jgi:hypothetical protein
MENDIKELVIARLQTIPDDKGISVGAYGELTRDQMIAHVKDGDDIGNSIVQIEMNFLRALKEGDFYSGYAIADAA